MRVRKLFLNYWLFCRLTAAIQKCCRYQSLQILRLRLLTNLDERVQYTLNLPQSLKSLKFTVGAANKVDGLMKLSSLKDLDLGINAQSSDITSQERTQAISQIIKEVIATSKSVL